MTMTALRQGALPGLAKAVAAAARSAKNAAAAEPLLTYQ